MSRAFGGVEVGDQCSACSADAAVVATPPASMHAMHCAVRCYDDATTAAAATAIVVLQSILHHCAGPYVLIDPIIRGSFLFFSHRRSGRSAGLHLA